MVIFQADLLKTTTQQRTTLSPVPHTTSALFHFLEGIFLFVEPTWRTGGYFFCHLARSTLANSRSLAEWKYLPVRSGTKTRPRLLLFLRKSGVCVCMGKKCRKGNMLKMTGDVEGNERNITVNPLSGLFSSEFLRR